MKTLNFRNYFKILLLNLILLNFFSCDLNAEIPTYELEARTVRFQNNSQLIIANGNAIARGNKGEKIYSDSIIYDKLNSTIITKAKSIYLDNLGNRIEADNFFYNLNLKIIEAKSNVKYLDKLGNIFLFNTFKYYKDKEIGIGKFLKSTLTDNSSLEGQYVKINNKTGLTIITNDENVDRSLFKKFLSIFKNKSNEYTTCKKLEGPNLSINESCPDWRISTTTTTHNKKEKMIYHENAVIKIKNIPVFYTPYFSHPDPSVKRKSGFLSPSTKNFTDLGRTYKAPYFWAINDNSDLTFTPIFYEEENPIYMGEFRKQNQNSYINIDTSYSQGYKNINKLSKDNQPLNRTNGSRNHFFLKFNGNYENLILENNDIELNIQRISQKNYLAVNQLNTKSIKQDLNELNNNIIINSYGEKRKIKIATNIYENLNALDTKKYQYTIPEIQHDLFFRNFEQNFNLKNNLIAKNYNANEKQIIQLNKLDSTSDQKIFENYGLATSIKTNFTNINQYNENTAGLKENLNNEFFGTIAIDNIYPLIKIQNKNEQEIITPRLFAKYTGGSMSNSSNLNKVLSYGDLYSMDRMNTEVNPETGASIGYGFDYEINNNDSKNLYIRKKKISFGQVLNLEKNKNLPTTSSLNEKRSNFVGDASLYFANNESNLDKISNNKNVFFDKINEGININYSFNISNNLEKILRNDFNINFKDKKNILDLSYYKLNEIGDEHNIKGQYQRKFNNDINFLMGIKKNIRDNYTENNFLELNYESDCLKIGLNLSKNFFENADLQKSNNLNLFVILKPFGAPVSPDLTSFLSN